MIKNAFVFIFNVVILGLILSLAASALWEWFNRIDPSKIMGYFPYANDYVYADGKTYKNSSPFPEENMPRQIDPKEPLPLKFGEKEYILRLGIKNMNSNQLVNTYIFLKLPEGVMVTNKERWQINSNSEYYICLGTVNPDMLTRSGSGIYLSFDKADLYTLTYSISGNFPIIRDRILPINVYKNE